MSFADSFRLPAMDARSLLDLADLSKEEQTLLKATYRTLALTLAAASAAVYLQLTSSSFLFHSMLPLLASFGLIAWLATTPPTPQNNTKREGILYGVRFFFFFWRRLCADVDRVLWRSLALSRASRSARS